MNHRTARQGYKVLIAAPYGRDAESMRVLYEGNGYEAHVCTDLNAVAAAFGEDVGVVLMTEEAFARDVAALREAIDRQPAWSEIPFLLLVGRKPASGSMAEAARGRLLDFFNTAIILERPLGIASLMSATASAMRSRQKQFEMRDRLADLQESQTLLTERTNALTTLNETLEEKVTQRTAELDAEMASRLRAEAALRQAQKMEAVGQLTGGIAHDFNNMLTGIIGGLDIVRRRIAAGRIGDIDRFMDAASASAQRAAGLTARLLAFSRRQSLDSKPLDPNALIGSIEGLLRSTLPETITLRIIPGADVPNTVVDANQLENAILNLAINARDTMPDGGQLTVETTVIDIDEAWVETRPDMTPGRYVVIAVSDTGVGMPPEIIEKVFDPFFTTKPIGQGTGLGLSMVYGFARQSGGHVRIHSQAGVGTSVSIYLAATEEAPAEADQAPAATPEGAGQTVLVVEDDPSVRLLIREVLDELSYASIEAEEADQAIPILASAQPIDLMISDVGLPGMNGRQLAEIARSHRPDLPILFVTGYAENAAIRAGFLGTGMAMVTKPFTLDALAVKISEMLTPAA